MLNEQDEMVFDVDWAMDIVRRLAFSRACGSEGERRAQELIAEEIQRLGIEPFYQEFQDWWIEPESPSLRLSGATIPVEPAVPLPFLAAFPWMEGVGIDVEVFGLLVEEKACGLSPNTSYIVLRELFEPESAVVPWAAAQLLLFPQVPEFIPYALVSDSFVPSAYVPQPWVQMVRRAKGTFVSLSWKPRRFVRAFRNLVAEIPGSRIPQEVVVLGAHLDSFPGTVGAADNAAGCAVVLEILRWFCQNPP